MAEWLVLLLGLGVVAAGSMIVEAGRRKFTENLHMTHMGARTRGIVKVLGFVGILARGSVFAVLGVFLVITAATFDSRQAQGLNHDPNGEVVAACVRQAADLPAAWPTRSTTGGSTTPPKPVRRPAAASGGLYRPAAARSRRAWPRSAPRREKSTPAARPQR